MRDSSFFVYFISDQPMTCALFEQPIEVNYDETENEYIEFNKVRGED